jgi:hypothetical protein
MLQPCEFRQYRGFAILIAYLAADFQGFVQGRAAPAVVAGPPAESAETAERTDEFVAVFRDLENFDCPPEMDTSFLRLAELRIGIAEIGKRGGFTIGVVRLAAKRQGLTM